MKIIIGNWKSNGTKREKNRFLTALNAEKTKARIVLCLPFTLLCGDSGKINIGAQDISEYPNGAYTGDVSGTLLHDIGAKYVIVGHNDRRKYHHETNQIVKTKANQAIKNGLIPIVCIGETATEKKSNKTQSVIKKMVIESIPDSGNFIIAYEPRWAIGTGVTPTNSDIESVHKIIFDLLKQTKHEKCPIIYGGSVTSKNISEIITISHVDGVLVGGASLKLNTFLPIIRNIK